MMKTIPMTKILIFRYDKSGKLIGYYMYAKRVTRFDSRLKHFKDVSSVFCKSHFHPSLIRVTSLCKGRHIKNWFSQSLTKRTATGNLVCSGWILSCMEKEGLKQCQEN